MSKQNAERVIFRKEYDEYKGKEVYLAVFPDDEARAGFLAYVSFFFTPSGDFSDDRSSAIFEPYGEMSTGYYYDKTKIVHKNTDEARRCLDAIKRYYNSDFRVVEKIRTKF